MNSLCLSLAGGGGGGGDGVRHVGQQLSLGGEKLLHPCGWRLVGLAWLRIGVGVVAHPPSRRCRLINS
jgi:hypothetical protein